jgi:hypothetical protein
MLPVKKRVGPVCVAVPGISYRSGCSHAAILGELSVSVDGWDFLFTGPPKINDRQIKGKKFLGLSAVPGGDIELQRVSSKMRSPGRTTAIVLPKHCYLTSNIRLTICDQAVALPKR